MVAPRNSHSGVIITSTSSAFADPALIAVDNDATESMRASDALAALVTLLERSRPSWHADADCRKHPDVDFHSKGAAMRSKAFSICATCPVRVRCLDWAVDEVADFTPAILGGCDGQARRRLAAQRVDKAAS